MYCHVVQIFRCLQAINHNRHAIAIYFGYVAEYYHFVTRASVHVNSSWYASNVVFTTHVHAGQSCVRENYNIIIMTCTPRGTAAGGPNATPPLCVGTSMYNNNIPSSRKLIKPFSNKVPVKTTARI